MESRTNRTRLNQANEPLYQLTGWLLGLSLFCVALFVIRYLLTGNHKLMFLPWNLFLAWIPFLISIGLDRVYRGRKEPSFPFYAWLIPWLFFYPNAPYLLTDLIHITESRSHFRDISIWYDIFALLFMGIAGLLLGFCSMWVLFRQIRKWHGNTNARVFYYASTFLCAVGLFLGRFLRWNSWDLFLRPFDVVADAVRVSGFAFFEMSAFIGFFFIFLVFVYEVLFSLNRLK